MKSSVIKNRHIENALNKTKSTIRPTLLHVIGSVNCSPCSQNPVDSAFAGATCTFMGVTLLFDLCSSLSFNIRSDLSSFLPLLHLRHPLINVNFLTRYFNHRGTSSCWSLKCSLRTRAVAITPIDANPSTITRYKPMLKLDVTDVYDRTTHVHKYEFSGNQKIRITILSYHQDHVFSID